MNLTAQKANSTPDEWATGATIVINDEGGQLCVMSIFKVREDGQTIDQFRAKCRAIRDRIIEKINVE